ncbi:MAG: hypothetical protein ACFE96_14620 [Candidatus Hermodarchaeota archaeon]
MYNNKIFTYEIHGDTDLSISYLTSRQIIIKGSGNPENPYVLTLSYRNVTSPNITIYDSNSYVKVRGSEYYWFIVNNCENISLLDSKFRNIWMEKSSNFRIKDLVVRNKMVIWRCENVYLEDSQIKLLYASKNNNVAISNCLIKTLKTKKDEQPYPQITNTEVRNSRNFSNLPLSP